MLTAFVAKAPASLTSKSFIQSVLSETAYGGIMALSLTLIVTMGVMDLSFSGVMGVGGLVFALVLNATGSIGLAIAAALIAGIACGVINGTLIVGIGMPAIVATIGTLFFFRGLTKIIPQGRSFVLEFSGGTLKSVFSGTLFGVPAQFLWVIALAVVMWFLLNRLEFGNGIRFIGDDEQSARMIGFNVRRIKFFTFVLMGVMSAFAGVINDIAMGTWWPSQGEGYFLPVFAMVFIGGTSIAGGRGTIFGTFLGILIMSIISPALVASGVSGFWTSGVQGIVIAMMIALHTFLRKR